MIHDLPRQKRRLGGLISASTGGLLAMSTIDTSTQANYRSAFYYFSIALPIAVFIYIYMEIQEENEPFKGRFLFMSTIIHIVIYQILICIVWMSTWLGFCELVKFRYVEAGNLFSILGALGISVVSIQSIHALWRYRKSIPAFKAAIEEKKAEAAIDEIKAETARLEAKTAMLKAETARREAETAGLEAVTARLEAETARLEALYAEKNFNNEAVKS